MQQRNIVAPGGVIETGQNRIAVRTTGEFNAVDEINSLVVGVRNGQSPIYLSDLGFKARRAFQEPPDSIARFTAPGSAAGIPCVVISLTMKDGYVITGLGRQVDRVLEGLRQSVMPPDIRVVKVSDQPKIVAGRLHDFLVKLGQAVFLVVLVAYLMIGFRIALVMATAIPVTIVISLGVVRLFGIQIEQISIVSFIIALGMLVDNAIEVCDNVHRLLDEGLNRFEAAVKGAGQIAKPILMATLTTVFAFLPMLTIPGDPGEFLRSLPVVVSTTLLVSWLVAMTLIVLMAHRFLRRGSSRPPLVAVGGWLRIGGGDEAAGGQFSSPIRRAYGGLTASCLRAKFTTIGCALSLLAIGIWLVMSGHIGTQFFPADERGQFVVDIILPEGSSIEATDRAARQVERIIVEHSASRDRGTHAVERLTNLITFIGTSGPRFYITLEPVPDAPNRAFILVNMSDSQFTEGYVEEIRRAVGAQVPGCRVVPRLLMKGPPVQAPIAVRVLGESPQVLARCAERITQALRDTDQAWDIHDSWGNARPELVVDTQEDRAKLSGVSQAMVGVATNTFSSGRYLTTFREDDHEIPVILRVPSNGQRDGLANLSGLHVEGQHGKIPLSVVADLELRWTWARIERHRKTRSMEVRARPNGGLLANSVLAEILPVLKHAEQELPPGYRIEISGEQEETTRSQKDMTFALQIAVMLIVLSLVIHHHDFVKPLVLLFVLPLAGTGALFGLFITGQPLGFMAMLGMLSLAGIALNDALVYTEFAETLIKEKAAIEGIWQAPPGARSYGGLTVGAFHGCLVQAGQMRMLPIWLTTLTTIGGLLPLALFGSALWQPLAVVVISGLLLSTALTLVVLPCVYAVFVERLRMKV